MEAEMIRYERKKPSIIIIIIVIVAAFASFNLSTFFLKKIINNIIDGIAGRNDFTIYHLLYVVSILLFFFSTMEAFELIRIFLIKEKTVMIRKSALENERAKLEIIKIKRNAGFSRIISGVLMALFVGLAGLSYVKTGDQQTYVYTIFILILINYFNPVWLIVSSFNKQTNFLLDECDPAAYIDFIELATAEAVKIRNKNYTGLITIGSYYYLGNYDEMERLINIYESRKITVREGIHALYYRGAAFINSGNVSGFNSVVARLSEIEKRIRLSDNERALVNDIKKRWRIMEGALRETSPDTKELILQQMKKDKGNLFRLELTYYLAFVQQKNNDEETALLNLKYVAKNGGTTLFCRNARGILWSKGISLE
ncbi:MAG: hypothetical protein IJV15_12995 [Lachnospiraceae bacterium]|nr:hypothetical protein [Lachnospiraceae bacterium]